jgi:hypothetical protein
MPTPRKKSKENFNPKDLLKQKISDLEHRLTMDIGALLVLLSEGSSEQVALANQRTKDLIKFGPDMQKYAEEIDCAQSCG